jgi:hypothetical protein
MDYDKAASYWTEKDKTSVRKDTEADRHILSKIVKHFKYPKHSKHTTTAHVHALLTKQHGRGPK